MFQIITFLIFFVSSYAYAQPEEGSSYVDYSREFIGESVELLGDKIDSLFGDDRTDDEANQSTLRLKQQYSYLEGEARSFDVEATLNLKLPNLEKREREFRESMMTQEEQGTAGKKTVKKKKKETWIFSQESGVRLSIPVNYFVKARVRRVVRGKYFIHYFYEQVGWDSERQWEEKTSLTSDYQIKKHLLFRIINEKDWGMTYHLLGTTHGVSLIGDLDDQTALSLDGRFLTKVENSKWYGEQYSIGSTLRHALSNKWMFIEVTPAVYFSRENNFAGRVGLLASLELAFGGNKN